MQSKNNPYFASLDGLRAFSILSVILYHAASKTGWINHFHGWLGVDIFFVLSGFLITFLLCREKRDTGGVDLGAFYIRRAFRILPVYAAVLLVYVVLTGFSANAEKWHQFALNLPFYLSFMNEYAHTTNGGAVFGYTWTLGVEEKFYLLWPFLLFVALAANRWKRGILAALYLGLIALAPVRYEEARSYSGLLVGCFLALALSSERPAWIWQRIRRIPVIVPFGLVIFGFWLIDRGGKSYLFVFSWMMAILVAHLLTTPSWLRTILSHDVLTWLGKRSYGMYLVHGLALDAVRKVPHLSSSLLVTFCTFGVSAFLADGMFRLIESPARNLGKRWLQSRKAPHYRRSTSETMVLVDASEAN